MGILIIMLFGVYFLGMLFFTLLAGLNKPVVEATMKEIFIILFYPITMWFIK